MPAVSEKQRRFQCISCSALVWRQGSRCRPCYLLYLSVIKRTREQKLQALREWHRLVKDEVFEAYGGYVCACCGETERVFLVIDHINNDGAKERRRLGTRGGAGQYWAIKKAGFPPGYRVLCHNCNFAMYRGGCPHALSIREAA